MVDIFQNKENSVRAISEIRKRGMLCSTVCCVRQYRRKKSVTDILSTDILPTIGQRQKLQNEGVIEKKESINLEKRLSISSI